MHVIPPNDEDKSVEEQVQVEPKVKQKKRVRFQECRDINELHDQMGHVSEQIIRRTMNHLGIGVAGKLKPCEACALHKAKQKPVKKATSSRAEKVGERLFMDISGPFNPSMGGSTYWVLVVDDFSRMGFCGFLKAKSDLAQWMVKLVGFIKSHGHEVKFIRCDNAGENKTAIELLQEKNGGIIQEYTAPHTPQQNGVVERRFPTLKMRASAMMKDANLTLEAKRRLWAEAAMMANILENITLNPKQTKTPFEIFTGKSQGCME